MRFISGGRHHALFDFGDLQVVCLRDGYLDVPPTQLRDETDSPLAPIPPTVPLANGNLRLSVNAFYITDGTQSVLVDTGASNALDPTMGSLYDALTEAGIERDDITDVAITHRHGDHVHGLITPDNTEAFPHLERVWVGAGDTAVFTGRLEPIRDRVVPIDAEVAINGWLTAVPTAGHTPGHTVYDVQSSTGHLLVWGDTVHVPSLQFEQPHVTWVFDGDQTQARQARATLLEQLVKPDYFVAGAHLDSPGIARVTRAGDTYALTYLAPSIS
jgi:glyoxylase-like metal-dependent hydrolase (beta-lactamase superfamily II)